ncbi:hypothetical protein JQ543_29060 [Bradyrhizobium diazoefficiens]|nr:hypothetical protein [Bradyrhizobium diazoefficiens]MBR0851819.1 hypothetical protein [Bradyrhizobium diazoefficiens]
MRIPKPYIVSLAVFGALSAIAAIPNALFWLFIVSIPLLGAPGFVVLAAPTILIYLLAIAPLVLARTAPNRPVAIGLVAIGLLIPVGIAIVPGWISEQRATEFIARMSADDVSGTADGKPRRIELIGNSASGLFEFNQGIGDKTATCNQICARLLFNGEVDWVRVTRMPDASVLLRKETARSVTYRIEHRDFCPDAAPAGYVVEKVVRDRLISGDCLIAEAGGNEAADATVRLSTNYSSKSYPPAPFPDAPDFVLVDSIKQFQINMRGTDDASPLRRQTETAVLVLAKPYYIGTEMHIQGGYSGPTRGRRRIVARLIDLAGSLRAAFGYEIGDIAPAKSDSVRAVAERILAIPASAAPVFSTQQQDVLVEALKATAKQASVSSADIELVSHIVTDDRMKISTAALSIQEMLRKNPGLYRPLIPVVLDRMSGPGDQTTSHYKSMLGWSLSDVSTNDLRPYREKMIGIVEAQPDWTTYGVLTRLAEFGDDDATSLVIRRLDPGGSRRSSPEFAAIAACRASMQAWPALQPAVLAYLASKTRNRLDDDESPLLLALVRFGQKAQAVDIVHKRGLSNGARVIERLNRFEPDFDPRRCRDRL